MTSFEIPSTMRALVQTSDADGKGFNAQVKDVPVPQLGDNQVLVKVSYTAQNPTDWKHSAFMSPSGVIHGGDYAGTIVKLGQNLKINLEIGDKVAGCIHGGKYEDNGAYSQYLKVDSDILFKIPQGLKEEDAATFGIAWVTACQAIVDHQNHPFPPAKVDGNPWYVIYGASSSVGLFAIPLAKALGFRVLAVASTHSTELVKSYGADAVVDYHDAEKAVQEGHRITGGGAEYGLDTISSGDSFKIALALLGEKGKQLNAILPPPEDVKSNTSIKVDSTLMYTLFGREFNFTPLKGDMIFPASEHDRAFGAEIYKHTPELITKYGIKPNPIKIRGGLDDVLAGWEDMKTGKVSGKKLVYKIE